MKYRGLLRGLIVACWGFWLSLQSYAYTRIVVFGDSLSDVGNTSSATFGIMPGDPYWQGRFSNGPVWIEFVGQKFGLPIVKSRSNGYNYAHGGAESGTGYEYLVIPNLVTQVNQYLSSRTPNASELYVVWAGGNDYLNGQTDPSVPSSNIEGQILRLYNAGARQFLVPNLPQLGYVPRYVGTTEQNTMNSLSGQHNAMLSQKMWALEALYPNIEIGKLDIQRMMTWIRYTPTNYGFLNVTDPAYDGSTVVPNPQDYAFWDDIHPTTAAHNFLASAAIECLDPSQETAIGAPY